MGREGSGCEEANPCSSSVSGNIPRRFPPTLTSGRSAAVHVLQLALHARVPRIAGRLQPVLQLELLDGAAQGDGVLVRVTDLARVVTEVAQARLDSRRRIQRIE